MSDVDLIIGVHVNGASEIANLSASLRALTANLRGINIPMSKMDAHTKALNKALGGASKSAGEHAKSLKELARNQKVIAEEAKRVKSNIDSYRTAIQMAGGASTAFGSELRQNQQDLQVFGKQLRGLKIRAFGSDLRSTSMHIQKIGKDAQFVGRSLMINLTAPILLFGRLGFSSLLRVNQEAVRLTKVLENVAMSAEQATIKLTGKKDGLADPAQVQQLIDNFNQLDKALTGVSTKFGVSKEIVVGLASDFAELGISSKENITSLVELTTTIEKLGSMDIGPAKDLSQALYFQSRRALETNGAFDKLISSTERNTRAIASATTQLYMFNAIENVTALSLQDLASALPEVGSMAVSFGLSMTEAAALLAPMKAAGLDVGASANSIKVSLQRALAPTKKNIDFLASLAKQYGVTSESQKMFNEATKSGLTGLTAIVDIFDTVQKSAAGAEGALFLMSQLFEKRQGPRMYLAIQELALFNRELDRTTRQSGTAESAIASIAETAIAKMNAANGTALPKFVDGFKDIGVLARIATATVGQVVEGFTGTGFKGVVSEKDIQSARSVREEVAKLVLQKRQSEGIDLIGDIKTESGKAFMVELIGATGAAQIAQNELDMSLASISTSTERLRNAFKLFAADLIRGIGPAIQKISDIITGLYERWQNTSEQFKSRVRVVVVAFLGLLASLGPLVLALGTLQASVGVMGRAVSFFIPKLKTMDNTFLGIVSSARKAAAAVGEYTGVLARKQATAIVPSFVPGLGSPGAGRAPLFGIPQRFGGNIGTVSPATGAVISKTPGRGAFGVSAATKQAVAQYTRNEAQMLAAQNMAVTKTGKLQKILPTGARSFISTPTGFFQDMAKASAMRESVLAEKGIRTSASGLRDIDLFGGTSRRISEEQALRIGRGGIAGRVQKARLQTRAIGDVVSAAPSKALAAYQASINGATTAVRKLNLENIALGGSAGKIKIMTTAMTGFMRATKLGTIAIKLMKVAMVSSGIGALVLAVGVAIMLVVKNFDQFKSKASGAFDGLKNALGILKNAGMALIEPILNLFSAFSKGGDSVDGVANAFKGIVRVIQFAARVVRDFVVKYIQPYMYAIMNIVAAVVSAFQGNWGKAFDYLVAAVSWAGKLVVNIFAGILKGAVAIVAIGVKGIIGYFTLIPKLLAKTLGFFGKWVPGLSAIGNAINTVIDGAFSLVDKGKNAVTGAINNAANAISSGLDKGAKKGISNAKQTLGKGKNDTKKEAGELGEAIANATGEGFSKEEDLGKRVADAIIEAAQELQDYVAGELKNAISKYVDESVKALNKQKESALKVFDVQLSTLTKLEKAEESLTRTKEYEAKKRKLIDDKTLSDEQFRRNIAVAIYEGRIDDARMLQLEQKASEKNFGEELKTIESDRAKDLAKENLEALKDAINEAKDAASKFFDESIEKFKTSIEEITKFPPITIDDYRKQTEKIMEITKASAEANGVEFGKMFDAFASSINEKMPNSVVGAFTTNLDELVMTAKEKYGLGADTSENTIIGATIGMLADIGGVFGDRKQEVIDSFGAVTTGLKSNLADTTTALVKKINEDFFDPFNEAIKTFVTNWKEIYTKAITDGNQSITDSLRNNVKINKDLLEEMRKNLSETTLKWLEMKVAAEQAAEAAANAGSGGPDSTTPDKPVPTGTMTSRADAFETNNRIRVSRGLAPISYAQFLTGQFGSTLVRTGGFAKGGRVKPGVPTASYMPSGFIAAPTQEGVPALLHGGEYIINAKAVSRIGVGALNKLNNNLIPRFAKGGPVPKKPGMGAASNKSGMRVADRAEQAIAKKTKDALTQKALATASVAISKKAYDWKKDENRNIVSDVINTGIDIINKTGLFETKNFFETIGAVAGTMTGGRLGSILGSSAGRATGSFFEQLIDSKKGVSGKTITREAGFGALHGAIGVGVDAALGKVVSKVAPKLLAKFINGPTLNELKPITSVSDLIPKKPLALTTGSKTGALELFKELRPGQLDLNPINISSGVLSGEKIASISGFKINDKIITFGNLGENYGESAFNLIDGKKINPFETVLKNIPDNPFAISNTSIKTSIGQDIAEKFHYARSVAEHNDFAFAYKGVPVKKAEQVNALLYGGARGDLYAMNLFDQMAAAGKTYTDNVRSSFSQKQEVIDELLIRIFDNRYGRVNKQYAERAVQNILNAKNIGDAMQDFALVHEKPAGISFVLDKSGNALMYPTSYFPGKFTYGNDLAKETVDYLRSEGIEPNIVQETLLGKNWRNTLHFGINAPAESHMFRMSQYGETIIANMREVFNANPGALDVINGVDTYFSAIPGQPLVVPNGSFEIIPALKIPDTVSREISNTGKFIDPAMQQLIDIRNNQIDKAIQRVNGTRMQSGVNYMVNEAEDSLIRLLASKTGFPHMLHSDTIVGGMGGTETASNEKLTVGLRDLANLSRNAIIGYLTDDRSRLFNLRYPENAMPRFKTGGYVPGMPSTPVPAILHGGEYVVNANAVKNMGIRTMESINQSRFRTPSGAPGVSGYGQTTSVSTVNINVDTFIGEEEWFKTMMKSYNLNVLPKNQKLAGNEGRIFTSYNGINQGM